MNNADSMGIVPGPGVGLPRTEEERKAAAEDIWRQERGFAAGVIIAGWVLKVGDLHLHSVFEGQRVHTLVLCTDLLHLPHLLLRHPPA